MVPRNTRTLIIKSGFPAGTSHAGVASIIANSLAGLVDSIQVCPGGIVRISFIDPAHKKTYEEAGSIVFGDVRCAVISSVPVSLVMVYLFPFEGSNDKVKEALKFFGDIKEVKHQQWTNVPGVYTGTRVVRMVRKHEIPRNIKIDGVNCRVWYRGQPLVCDICHDNHKAADCPLKGKCRRCHEAGHFVRACPKPVWFVPGNPATDVDSENENDDDNNVSDNVSGAEVVPAAAPGNVSGAAEPVVVPEVVPAENPAEPGPESEIVEAMSIDVRDNELDELVSQPLLDSGSGGVEERVLDPSPSQVSVGVLGGAEERVLDPSPSPVSVSVSGASTGQVGVPQEEVLVSSPSFSPLSGSVLSDSGDDAPASLVDARPVRSKIPVKVGRSGSGGLHPPLVSREETVGMVERLKAALPSSTDDLVVSGQAGSSPQPSHGFTVPLPPRVSSRSSGSGMALRPSSRSRSRSGDERAPLSPDPHRSRRRAPSPSPARRR